MAKKNGYERAGVITDPAARERWKVDGDHQDRCAVCWRPWSRAGWLGFAVHHLVRGSNGRSDEPANMLMLCARCHDMVHDGQYRDEITKELLPAITFGMVLRVKSRSKEWDAARLEQLYHRALPDMERLSLYYLNERLRWSPAKGASE